MKQWEVMRLLEENPTKVYEAELSGSKKAIIRIDGGYYRFEVFNRDGLIDQSEPVGAFNGNSALRFEWHEVKQPVTW